MKLLPVTALAGLVFFAAACGNFDDPNAQGTSKGSGKFVSVDGSVEIQCPEKWALIDLNDESDIEVGDNRNEDYVIVLSESKQDYAGTLEEHSADTRAMLVSGLTGVQQDGPTALTINGNKAIQYKITATIDRVNIVYLHTSIESATKFHQVLGWTYASRFSKSESTLQSVVKSLKEITPTP